MRFFGHTSKAVFLSRPNRFTVTCQHKGKTVRAFLPNPGRLRELLLPGTALYIEESRAKGRTLRFTTVAAERDGEPVMLHTHRTNEVARRLIQQGLIPGLEDARILRGEVTRGRSRFDFLLEKGGKEMLLEVKSCTLFSRHVALFPDAVTARGRKHVEELAAVSDSNTGCAVLFLIHSSRPGVFLPEYHVDAEFAASLYTSREKIAVLPVSVRWRKDLSLDPKKTRVLPIPWEIVERESGDRGAYLLVLNLPAQRTIEAGGLGKLTLKKGFYVYAGSAGRSLEKRVERHRRLRKRLFWHIDYLRKVSSWHAVFPIRTEDDIECAVAGDLYRLSEWQVKDFGSSDCHCPSHLFGFAEDPLSLPSFHRMVLYHKADRLIEKYRLS